MGVEKWLDSGLDPAVAWPQSSLSVKPPEESLGFQSVPWHLNLVRCLLKQATL